MKVYLIGYLYDDFREEGFEVIEIVSTREKALCRLYYLNEEEEKKYEIREWEVDVIEPVGDIIRHGCQYGTEKFNMDRVLPYKVIKEEGSDKND